jgi:hypothetical protein
MTLVLRPVPPDPKPWMSRIAINPSALAAAMNAELYRRGVPAFVRVGRIVRAEPRGAEWTFSLERSPVPLDDDETAERFAAGLFRWEDEVDAVARWAAERFTVAWDEPAQRREIFIPAPEPAARPAHREAVGAENGTGGE